MGLKELWRIRKFRLYFIFLVILIFGVFFLFFQASRVMGQSDSPFGKYIIDWADPKSITQWLQDAKFEKLAEPDDRMRLICVNVEVLRHGASPESVVTLGYFKTPLGGTIIICSSDVKVPDNIYIRRTCKVVNRKFIKVEGSLVICASKVQGA